MTRSRLFGDEPVPGIRGLVSLTAPGADEPVAGVIDVAVFGARSDGKTQFIAHAIRTLRAYAPADLDAEERRQNLPIAMPCRVKIEHIVDEGPFESRAGPSQDRKPCAGNFRRTVEIQNAKRFAEIPMALGWCGQRGRGSPPSFFFVAARIFSDGNRNMRKIRDAEIQIGQGLFDTP